MTALGIDAPIVVGGFYRSGTTLLRRLLDSHSRIHCGPEVKFFKDFYGDYRHDDLHHVRLFSTAATLGLTQDELMSIFGRAFVQAHERAAQKAGKRRWADKNPENVLYLEQWRRLLPDGFYFVHVVRSPLDALASLKEAGFPKAVPPAFGDKIELYRQFYEAACAHTLTYPDRSATVRYEELVHSPRRTLETLFSALGERMESQVLDCFADEARGNGIEDPKAARSTEIYTHSVERWRRDLNAEEVEAVRLRLPEILDVLLARHS
jgi:hypothetical protein